MPSPSPRSSLYGILLCLAAAQIVVAAVVRRLMWPQIGLAGLLRSILRQDLIVIAGFAGTALVLALLLGGNRRGRVVVLGLAWIAALAHLTLLAINYTAVTWLRAPLTLSWMQMADLGGGETPWLMVRSVMSMGMVIGLAAALVLPFALVAVVRHTPLRRLTETPWPLLALAMLCALLALTGRPAKTDQWRDALSNPAQALWSSLSQAGFDDVLQARGDGRNAAYVLRPAEAAASAPARPDMLVIVLESVSAKAVMDNLADLPTLAGLVRTGTVFPNASVSVATSSRSMFSLLFSRHPRLSYEVEPRVIDSGYPEPFLKTLRHAGYATTFVMGGDFDFQGAGRMLDHGDAGSRRDYSDIPCDTRVDRSTARMKNHVYLPDRCTFAEAERWFTAHKGPRAAIVWPVSTHFPYDFDVQGKHPAGSKQAYLTALRNTDRVLGQTLRHLADKGVRPVVAVIGDHGEAFGEHGFVMHAQTMFQEEIGVPLILSGPGIASGQADPRLAQIVDIAPTLVSLAGAARPCGWQGLSLLGADKRDRAYAFAVVRGPLAGYREGNRKYVLNLGEGTTVRYDLGSDPGEQRPVNLTGAEADVARTALAGWATYNARLYNNAGRGCQKG